MTESNELGPTVDTIRNLSVSIKGPEDEGRSSTKINFEDVNVSKDQIDYLYILEANHSKNCGLCTYHFSS